MSCTNIHKIPRINAKSYRAVSQEEYEKIIAEIPSKSFLNLRDRVMINLLWDTGVRVSELCNLDVTQIIGKKQSTVIQTKKTGRRRIIVWSEKTHLQLMEYLKARVELKNCRGTALFLGNCNNSHWSLRITTRGVERILKHYVQRAEIKERITPHSFRHGWAHKRRDYNAPLAFIQRGLGHSNPVSTFIYEQYNDNEFEKNATSYL